MEKVLIKRKIIIDFFDDKKKYISTVNDLIKDDKYILWIDDFMKNNIYFTNEPQYHLCEDISLEDINNMMSLNYFYNIVELYAKYVGFSSYHYEDINYYLIKYNGNGYKIMRLDKSLFLCHKIDITDNVCFFDYENIKNNMFKRYN